MSAAYLTAFEHQALDVGAVPTADALESAEADALDILGQQLEGFCDRRYRSVRLANFCGIVRMGRRLLEILPKIDDAGPPVECRGVLLNLLRRSSEQSVFRHVSTSQQLRNAPLIDAFIATFFDSVRDIVRGGLMRQYQEEHDDLRVVRGRIAAARQFSALADRHDIVACQFDELTADNVWNRFIKAGLRAVKPWISSVDLRRRWTDLLIAFDEVADVEFPAGTRRLPVDRKAARYLPAVEWVRRILALQSPALRAGTEDSPGLLFNINVLWEAAVAAEMRRLLSDRNVELKTQLTGMYLAGVVGSNRRTISLRPDLAIFCNGQLIAIADTKWKRLEVGRGGYLKPSPADLYQMHAYAAAFGCEHLALIYPWHTGLAAARETVLELPSIGTVRPRVSMACIDVRNGEFRPVLASAALERMLC